MKYLQLIVFIFVLFIAPMVQAEPKFVMPETRVVLQDPVMEGTEARGEFHFTNEGDTDLNIAKVSPG